VTDKQDPGAAPVNTFQNGPELRHPERNSPREDKKVGSELINLSSRL